MLHHFSSCVGEEPFATQFPEDNDARRCLNHTKP